MKTLFRILLLFPLLLFAGMMSAQSIDTTGLAEWNPFDGNVTVDGLKDTFNVIYGALVIVWGYVARLIGWKNRKIPFVFIVLAGGAVIAGVFIALGMSKAIPLVISFLLSLGLFDTVFKPIQKAIGKKELKAEA